jgi:dTDP-4-dehydrorhamnose 3,5-epimerase
MCAHFTRKRKKMQSAKNDKVRGIQNKDMGIHITPTKLPGAVIIDVDAFRDARGFFAETYHKTRYFEHGLTCEFVQDNHSRSSRGVLRGLHFQDMTSPQDKLLRCTVGRIFDVAVDIRAGSPTFGQWAGVELSAENMRQFFVPVGFAHGFLTLSDVAELQYKCTSYYAPAAEGAIRWDDPDVGIDWPMRDPVLSGKDAAAPSLEEYLKNPRFVWKA